MPVVVVNQRHRAPEETRAAVAELERSLGIEREARFAAEKALAQAEETIRQLRTRLAHAEIARDEVAAAPPPPVPPPAPSEEEAAVLVAPKRGRPRKVPATDAAAGDAAAGDAATGADHAEEDGSGEAIEWWRPGWRERLRKGQ